MCTERVRKAAHGFRPGAPGSPLTPEMQPVSMGGTRTRSVKNRNLHWSWYIYPRWYILYIIYNVYLYIYHNQSNDKNQMKNLLDVHIGHATIYLWFIYVFVPYYSTINDWYYIILYIGIRFWSSTDYWITDHL